MQRGDRVELLEDLQHGDVRCPWPPAVGLGARRPIGAQARSLHRGITFTSPADRPGTWPTSATPDPVPASSEADLHRQRPGQDLPFESATRRAGTDCLLAFAYGLPNDAGCRKIL